MAWGEEPIIGFGKYLGCLTIFPFLLLQAQILNGKWILGPGPGLVLVPVPDPVLARDPLDLNEAIKARREAAVEEKAKRMGP